MVIIRGHISFEGSIPSLANAIIYVRLEDVSRIDAASATVSEQVIRGITASDAPIQFQLAGDQLDEQARYIISVHVDVNGDGILNSGDYLTMESYPITVQKEPQHIMIRVHPLH